MKIRHILILALAACTVTAATAQKKSGKSKKAKTEKTVKTTKMTPAKVQPVPAAEFSYARARASRRTSSSAKGWTAPTLNTPHRH